MRVMSLEPTQPHSPGLAATLAQRQKNLLGEGEGEGKPPGRQATLEVCVWLCVCGCVCAVVCVWLCVCVWLEEHVWDGSGDG